LVVEFSELEVLDQKEQHRTTGCGTISRVMVPHSQWGQNQSIFQQQQKAEALENLLHSCNNWGIRKNNTRNTTQ
jgi:hypothetical protein